MKALLTVDDVAAILKVSRRTAYGYMMQMPHMERPRRVTEGALEGWINGRTVYGEKKRYPAGITRIPRRREVS